jgi:putative endonuclease
LASFLTNNYNLKSKKENKYKLFIFVNMFQQEGYHTYYIYIITNKAKSVLYIGVTNNLKVRLKQHHDNLENNTITFASRYKVHYLLYFEKFTWIQEAIAREKELKKWRREKKIDLIKTINPELNFLNDLFE